MDADASGIIARIAEVRRRTEATMDRSASLMTRSQAAVDASTVTLIKAARIRATFHRLLGKIP